MVNLEYFPGANTPKGFYSYYDYILKSEEAKRIIILKGGPGTGKSTFMKKIAKHLISLGYETELLHCSSDPNSLDGVCSRECGFLILDGTAPHIVDPKCPGAVDEIINLGECWDAEKIVKNKNQIIQIGEKISSKFKDAYKFLAAAKCLQIENEPKCYKFIDYEVEKLKNKLSLDCRTDINGKERKAFISAITPIGRINYSNTFSDNSKYVFKIKANNTNVARIFMKKLAIMFIESGYDIRTFYCPMSPDEKIEHIYVDKMFFTVENDYHSLGDDCIVNLDENVGEQSYLDIKQFNFLLDNAENNIKEAKKLHDELEDFYIPYMDFDKVELLYKNVIKSIN